LKKADPAWLSVFYFLGVLYLFLAIAIVCDELFVPALEEMASDRHMGLSMDVAGATLMAAGGSAPELFTSLFGTFVTHSEVGIGTVVGSAVFNVLFVIAMCALLTKEVLALTWWPLFRDSAYYSLGLIALGTFVGIVSPNEIELWEAVVLFLMYIGYVVLMVFNRKLYKTITGHELSDNASVQDAASDGGSEQERSPQATGAADEEAPRDDSRRVRLVEIPLSNRSIASSSVVSPSRSPPWPGTFRTGVLKLLRDPKSCWIDTAGVGIVAQIAGNCRHVFREVDVDDNGEIDKEELAQLFAELECGDATSDELDSIMEELDADHDGKITEQDFTVWYIKSEKQILSRVRTIFDHFDTNHSGTINRTKVKMLLATVEPAVTDDDVNDAMVAMYQQGSHDEISFEEFSNWYIHSLMYDRETKRVEEEDMVMKGIWESIKLPSNNAGCILYAKYILVFPIVIALALTVPDVRTGARYRKYCYIAFLFSIGWIGFFSYFMVEWAEIIGNTIGIPSVIMGLTLLAAGTSVPDLLSSVIVARMGEGDMALSSSIGSNIFDILVGLPLPWIIYTAWNKTTITVSSELLLSRRMLL
jgi:K+-dependent Na+/Ca+ exchanger-like protein